VEPPSARRIYGRVSEDIMSTPKGDDKPEAVEGEGSYTATRRYNEHLEQSIKKGNSDALAHEAETALEGPEGEALRKAEQIGKSGKPRPKNG